MTTFRLHVENIQRLKFLKKNLGHSETFFKYSDFPFLRNKLYGIVAIQHFLGNMTWNEFYCSDMRYGVTWINQRNLYILSAASRGVSPAVSIVKLEFLFSMIKLIINLDVN